MGLDRMNANNSSYWHSLKLIHLWSVTSSQETKSIKRGDFDVFFFPFPFSSTEKKITSISAFCDPTTMQYTIHISVLRSSEELEHAAAA